MLFAEVSLIGRILRIQRLRLLLTPENIYIYTYIHSVCVYVHLHPFDIILRILSGYLVD